MTNSMTWTSPAKAETPSASLAPQGGARGTFIYPWKEGYVLLTKATSKTVQNGGVFTGLLTEQKVKMPFPQKDCSTGDVQNTVLHRCCCFPKECLIPWHGCHQHATGWMQLGMARRDTAVLSVWESVSWSIGPFRKQAIYQINSPWNILAPRSETITSINNEVFPKSAGDHKEKTFRISIWQNTPLFDWVFSPSHLA